VFLGGTEVVCRLPRTQALSVKPPCVYVRNPLICGGDERAVSEMVSLYTTDGPDLVMTHYCVLGNQPRMKADPNSPPNQIVFCFIGGGNLNPEKDRHMHEATLTIVSDERIEINGIGWENGAPAKDMCCGLKLVRKK
jgi:hypothetical protein